MSIYGLCGLPGAGKSYHAVSDYILPAVRAGRRVVTNVPVRLDRLPVDAEVVELVPEDEKRRLARWDDLRHEEWRDGDLVVLDEVSWLMPTGQRLGEVPDGVLEWFSLHRHCNQDIVFITQDLGNIAAWARRLVEQTVAYRKLRSVGMNKWAAASFDGAHPLGRLPRQSVSERGGRYRSEVFELYDSHLGGGLVSESGRLGRDGVVWRSWKFQGAVVMALLAAGFTVWHAPRSPMIRRALHLGDEAEAAAVEERPVVPLAEGSAPAARVEKVRDPFEFDSGRLRWEGQLGPDEARQIVSLYVGDRRSGTWTGRELGLAGYQVRKVSAETVVVTFRSEQWFVWGWRLPESRPGSGLLTFTVPER